MHTLKVLLAGFALLAVFFCTVHWFGYPASYAAGAFALAWLACAGLNLWYGVSRAGYAMRDELPIFLLVFALPVLLAGLLCWTYAGP